MNKKFKSNPNVVYSCCYYVVWCPKYLRKVLIDGVDTRLKEILQEVASEVDAEILEMEIAPDNVYLLVEVDPQLGIAKLVRSMKARSSRLLRQEFSWLRSRLPTLWNNGYFCATVGGAPLDSVRQYIQNQKHV